jgi:hypothetical protein
LELALNIAWLILSLALVAACIAYGRPAVNSRSHRIVVAISLACLIAFLLFPIISMTDDLNSGVPLAEISKPRHLLPTIELFALVGTGLLIAFSAQSSTWADGSILSELGSPSQETLSFHMSRRPPPAVV